MERGILNFFIEVTTKGDEFLFADSGAVFCREKGPVNLVIALVEEGELV
jgi:hypothetical protein